MQNQLKISHVQVIQIETGSILHFGLAIDTGQKIS